MTSGSLWKNILLFSLPLMGSQVLEVLFNLSDVAVVGRFADYMALGAVGSTTLLVTLFTGILIGMGAGVNVRVAHELGAENRKGTEETIHTSLLLCAIAGLLVCVVCLLFSGQMLSMMNTKPELMDQAVLYMKIYALGMPAMAVYNFGNGVLSARGDTKRPLIYLSIAGVINVLLNLFFVIGICGTDEFVIRCVHQIPDSLDLTVYVINEFLRCNTCFFCFQLNLLAMLVSSGLEKYVVALLSFITRNGVCQNRLVGIANVRLAGCIGNGCGDVIFWFTHCISSFSV